MRLIFGLLLALCCCLMNPVFVRAESPQKNIVLPNYHSSKEARIVSLNVCQDGTRVAKYTSRAQRAFHTPKYWVDEISFVNGNVLINFARTNYRNDREEHYQFILRPHVKTAELIPTEVKIERILAEVGPKNLDMKCKTVPPPSVSVPQHLPLPHYLSKKVADWFETDECSEVVMTRTYYSKGTPKQQSFTVEEITNLTSGDQLIKLVKPFYDEYGAWIWDQSCWFLPQGKGGRVGGISEKQAHNELGVFDGATIPCQKVLGGLDTSGVYSVPVSPAFQAYIESKMNEKVKK